MINCNVNDPKKVCFQWNKYDINGEDGEVYYKYESFKRNKYSSIRKKVELYYIETIDEFIREIEQHKSQTQFKHWYLFKNIADYKLFNLNTTDVQIAKSSLQKRDKTHIHQLYDAKYKIFINLGLEEMSKFEFTEHIIWH